MKKLDIIGPKLKTIKFILLMMNLFLIKLIRIYSQNQLSLTGFGVQRILQKFNNKKFKIKMMNRVKQ